MPPSDPLSVDRNFYTSCDAILKNWTALQLAVTQEAGGPQSKAKAQWFADALVQWFNENKDLEADEVTYFLEQLMMQEFNLRVEDGSSDEIGVSICKFYKLCTSSKTSEEIISEIRTLPKCDLSRCQIEGENSNPQIIQDRKLEEQLNSMEVDSSLPSDSSKPKQEPDADGWLVVDRKKK